MKTTLIVYFIFLGTLAFSQDANRSNLSVANAYFEFLFKKGDFVSLKKIVSENALYTQALGLPYGGTYKGFDEWMVMFTKVQSYFDLKLASEPIFYNNLESNRILSYFSVTFKSKKTSKEITMNIIESFELKDGKIVGVTPFYFDTKTLVELMN